MSQPIPPARSFELRVELDAPPEHVWKAVAEGEELRRWFPLDARVTPGQGGKVWLSWGEGMAAESTIEIWDPPRRMKTVSVQEAPWSGGESKETGPVELSVDWRIEARAGGGTILRLVHSGFGRGQGWDDDFDSISNGWKFEVRSLRHYLERHRGTDRRCAYVRATSALAPTQVWERLMQPDALCREGSLAGLKEGDPYRLVMADGAVLAGTVLMNNPPRAFVGTVASFGDALLRVEIERSGDKCGPFLWLSAWGAGAARADELRARFKELISALFGEAIGA